MDLATVDTLLTTTRTVRKRLDCTRPVDPEIIQLRYEQEAAAVLGIPSSMRQAALLPVAYYTGEDFKPAKRVPARERTYWNGWGQTR